MKNIALDLDHYDGVIFVSKASVRFGLPVLEDYWPQWPVALDWFAVGPGTALALNDVGLIVSYPQVPGSEGLLAMEGLKEVRGKNILIVRGNGGRELLGESLRESGASVTYLEAYDRTPLECDFSDLTPGSIVILTSAEIMENFVEQIADKAAEKMRKYHTVVPSARLAELAKVHAFGRVTNAGGASDEALYDAVMKAANTSGSVNE